MVNEKMVAIGLMSGTSMDGIDAAIITTDGKDVFDKGASCSFEYSDDFKNKIRGLILGSENQDEITKELTILHADAVHHLLKHANKTPEDIDVIGFHGQTIAHDPDNNYTLQIGDGRLLAELTGICVVNDMRKNDVLNGGQGAPLAPLYHAALAKNDELPIAILNIGGVSNVTWIGGVDDIIAFDTGPGNALIDDWVLKHKGIPYDKDGAIAASGAVDKNVLSELMSNSYFSIIPPKSLDRNHFHSDAANHLALADGAATLTQFTVESIVKSAEQFPEAANRWYVTGGGRHNATLMNGLREYLKKPILPIEELGCDGDMIEAEAWAFLAVRSIYGMPLSLPATTGVNKPLSGGVVFEVAADKAASMGG